ncbi:flagellar motor protein MotB [Oceanobacillus sp. CAU 1775]
MSRRKKRKARSEETPDESWLLPYSDMLTLLVALFIVLFSMSQIDVQKYDALASVFKSEFSGGSTILEQPLDGQDEIEIIPDEDREEDEKEIDEEASNSRLELMSLREIQEDINQYIEDNNLTDSLETVLTNEGLFIQILSDISFDPGSADVKPEGMDIAEEVSVFLNTSPPHQIMISGHADDVPMNNEEFGSNWELSVMRAISFMREVLQNDELDPTMFSARGYGEYRPRVPNTSAENRAKNRRVEVLILPNYEINVNE